VDLGVGELPVGHYHTIESSAPYTIDRLVRLTSSEEQNALSAGSALARVNM
jgi:hypothetical protein